MTIRDCETCPGKFTAGGDEVLCPVCSVARIRDRVAENISLAILAMLASEEVLATMEIEGRTSWSSDKVSVALRLVRRALGKEG